MKRWGLRLVCPGGLVAMLVLGADGKVGAGAGALPNGGLNEASYEEPRFLAGAIYSQAAQNQQLLFKFQRESTRSGETLQVQRDFAYPDGRLAAREHVVYEKNTLVLYELQDLQSGAMGSARILPSSPGAANGRIAFSYIRKAGTKPKTRTELLKENPLVNDMVGPFLLAHWGTIEQGEKLSCRYIVVPRMETVGFTFQKDSESVRQGRRVVRVRMEATSPFVAALVAPLLFTIEETPPHHVLRYIGPTTPRIQEAGKWKDLTALTVFDWDSAR